MKRARVAYAGAIHEAVPHADGLLLADGRVLAEEAVVWLPPVAPLGTIVALGLNYADHAKELAFGAQDEPLAFLKGPNTLIGHRGQTRRPAGVTFLHYECELAVVIGRRARRVKPRWPISEPGPLMKASGSSCVPTLSSFESSLTWSA